MSTWKVTIKTSDGGSRTETVEADAADEALDKADDLLKEGESVAQVES